MLLQVVITRDGGIIPLNICHVHCFTDVAIGAPKEDNYIGAVYIYHGDANGIVPQYSMVRGTCSLLQYLTEIFFLGPAGISYT